MAQISPYPAPVRRHSSVRLGGDEIRLRAQLLHLEEQALCEEAVGFPVAAKDRVHQEEGPVCEEAIQEHPDLSDLSFIRQEAGGDAVKMDAHLLPLAADEGHFIGVAVKVVVGVARLRAQDGGGQGAGLHAHGCGHGDGSGEGAAAEAGEVVDHGYFFCHIIRSFANSNVVFIL